jgi:hypothetical protein
MHYEIILGLNAANRGYYAISKIFSSRLLSRETTRKLYISYLQHIVMDHCETCSSIKGNETKLLTFGRKGLRKINSPMYNTETKQYESKTNKDIERIYNVLNIRKYLVPKKLEWAGHIWRHMDSLMRQLLAYKLNKTRSRRRPCQHCLDRIKKDLVQVNKTARIKDQ